eukprot:CAMPEP_0201714850 /NCGR_PEP_ID=MMETSP0593-20130828/1145_1 /ASSEMBLY_ACC=CAM_ASM_000672 /TAXON_ID=267983 /ORGANISM="Skeletonema japonicum, Strain CCMP2506" /LENGTH=309 /DNA_ID=CAMNT_0048204163 /DNA_START=263 /DNA_END=1192 /DNA_ORIENTATION=-
MICTHGNSRGGVYVLFRWSCLFLSTLQVGGAETLQVPKSETEYSEEFFLQHKKNAHVYPALASSLGSHVIQKLKDSFTVLDMGCGHGLLVEAWRNLGVSQSYCVEGSESASSMWPSEYKDEYYQILNLTKFDDSADKIPQTDVVTTFEVAEHLPEESATDFVRLLVLHNPALVFFGAATVFQDRGMNPSHVNENTFAYWIEKFKQEDYIPDLVSTAYLRNMMMQNPGYATAWWYPKNVFVFVPTSRERELDLSLAQFPPGNNVLDPALLNWMPVEMWKRDWTEFGTLFYKEQLEAKKRLAAASIRETEL